MMTNDLPKENLDPTNPKFWSRGPFKICKKLITTFSSSGRHRCHPPSPHKTKHVRLITIGPSHYCEKARWALDILNNDPSSPVYFTEDAHPPVFQSISSLEASNGEASMVPMVVFQESGVQKVIHDSKEIVFHFCPSLYPIAHKDEILRLEEYFGSQIGATLRCYIYFLMLRPKYYASLAKLLTTQSSTIEKVLLLKLLENGLAKGMIKVMGINSESGEKSLESIRRVFAEVSDGLKLKDGTKKKFIMDSETEEVGFTAADLAFCALVSPLINPPEIKAFVPVDDDEMPPELILLRDELRMTLAGQHVMDVYRKYRKTVVPKVVNKHHLRWKEIFTASKL